jgi:hypothetical protein
MLLEQFLTDEEVTLKELTVRLPPLNELIQDYKVGAGRWVWRAYGMLDCWYVQICTAVTCCALLLMDASCGQLGLHRLSVLSVY